MGGGCVTMCNEQAQNASVDLASSIHTEKSNNCSCCSSDQRDQKKNERKLPTLVQSMRYNDGSIFQGELKEGKREGYGIQIWQDGTKYSVESAHAGRVDQRQSLRTRTVISQHRVCCFRHLGRQQSGR